MANSCPKELAASDGMHTVCLTNRLLCAEYLVIFANISDCPVSHKLLVHIKWLSLFIDFEENSEHESTKKQPSNGNATIPEPPSFTIGQHYSN